MLNYGPVDNGQFKTDALKSIWEMQLFWGSHTGSKPACPQNAFVCLLSSCQWHAFLLFLSPLELFPTWRHFLLVPKRPSILRSLSSVLLYLLSDLCPFIHLFSLPPSLPLCIYGIRLLWFWRVDNDNFLFLVFVVFTSGSIANGCCSYEWTNCFLLQSHPLWLPGMEALQRDIWILLAVALLI